MTEVITAFDLSKLEEYQEGNRLEAKLAQNNLPSGIWETYSAFANTDGGVILLGVAEDRETRKLQAVGVPDAAALIKQLWDSVNNRQMVSCNILSAKSVTAESVDGRTVVVVNVPRAHRQARPVHLRKDVFGQTYRRNGEGDYHCTEAEVKGMIRDSGETSNDRLVLENLPLGALNTETIGRYRMLLHSINPEHAFLQQSMEGFLQSIGAARFADDGGLHPTMGGLLMFGNVGDITNECPDYFLDYREPIDAFGERWKDRVTSGAGDWSGNLFDFYSRAENRLYASVKVPFRLRGSLRIDWTPMHHVLREALANALIHADYNGYRGVVVSKRGDEVTFSNPGAMRMSVQEAMSGGNSDPRNAALFQMFYLVSIVERAGAGLLNISQILKNYKLPKPVIEQRFAPDRTTLTLKMRQEDGSEPVDYDIMHVASNIRYVSGIYGGIGRVGDNVGNVGNYSDIVGNSNGSAGIDVGNVGDYVGNVGINVGNVGIHADNISGNVVNAGNSLRAKVLAAIRADPYVRARQIAEAEGVSTRQVERWVRALRDEGVIERVGGTRGHWRVK